MQNPMKQTCQKKIAMTGHHPAGVAVTIATMIGLGGIAPARAEWLVQGGAEIYLPFATTIKVDDKQATLKNQKAGGFFGLFGYRFSKGLDISAEYVFLQHHAKLTSQSEDAIFNNTAPSDNFYVSHHLVLGNVGYRFGRSWGLGNFGIYLGSGLGFEMVNGAVAGGAVYNDVAFVLPFKFAVDYKVNELLWLSIHGRYYLPLGGRGKVNGMTATTSSAGGLSAGLSLGFIF